MNSIELKRVEFRHYLEKSGVMDALSAALIKLYDEPTKPNNPVAFVRQHFRNKDDVIEEQPESGHTERVSGTRETLVEKLQTELDLARKEILSLRSSLETMMNSAAPKNTAVPDEHPEEKSPHNSDTSYAQLCADGKFNESMLKKYLTEDLFVKLSEEATVPFESTLMNCIRACMESTMDEHIGLLATDSECYNMFFDVFEPIIRECHNLSDEYLQPTYDWGSENELSKLDPDGDLILSTKFTCRRSLEEFPFVPRMSAEDFENVYQKIEAAVQSLKNEKTGRFHKMSEILENEDLTDELQVNRTDYSESYPLWPNGRGIYIDGNKTLLILINEEDHVRFISVQPNGDFANTHKTLVSNVKILEKELNFIRHDKFGWLTVNPRNVGSTLQCEVFIKPVKRVNHLDEICRKYQLLQRTPSESESKYLPGVQYVISNRSSFAANEFEIIKRVHDGISELISLENFETDAAQEQAELADDATKYTAGEREISNSGQEGTESVENDSNENVQVAEFTENVVGKDVYEDTTKKDIDQLNQGIDKEITTKVSVAGESDEIQMEEQSEGGKHQNTDKGKQEDATEEDGNEENPEEKSEKGEDGKKVEAPNGEKVDSSAASDTLSEKGSIMGNVGPHAEGENVGGEAHPLPDNTPHKTDEQNPDNKSTTQESTNSSAEPGITSSDDPKDTAPDTESNDNTIEKPATPSSEY